MVSKKLPRDYMALFTGNHFLHDGYDKGKVTFQSAHKTSCELVSEAKPQYGDRRLAAMALPYTMFLLLERDVISADDNLIHGLFVEVFSDKDRFFEVCVNEMDRSDAVISVLRAKEEKEEPDEEESGELEEELDIPESEEKVKLLYDRCLKNESKVVLTRYMKIFDLGHTQVLAITHAKMNKDFYQIFKKLKFEEQKGKTIKCFTHPKAQSWMGEGNYIASSCKTWQLRTFSKEFRLQLLALYGMEEKDEDVLSVEGQSQDFPEHSQNKTDTLRICHCCRFRTRDQEELESHITDSHPKCPGCGVSFTNKEQLEVHYENYHMMSVCKVCNQEVMEAQMKRHMEAHKAMKSLNTGMVQGKVRAKKTDNLDETVCKRGTTGWNLFCKEVGQKLKLANPLLTQTVGEKQQWKQKAKEQSSEVGGKDTEARREVEPEAGRSQEVREEVSISCPLCPKKYIYISSMGIHMVSDHGAKRNEEDSMVKQARIHTCRTCRRMLTSEKELNNHIKKEHGKGNQEPIVVNETEEPLVTLDEIVVNETEETDVEDKETEDTQGGEAGGSEWVCDPGEQGGVVSVEEDGDDGVVVGKDLWANQQGMDDRHQPGGGGECQAQQELVEAREGSEEDNQGVRVGGVFKLGDVVLVRRKTVYWPGKVIQCRHKEVEVQMFDKPKTILNKDTNHIKPFIANPSSCKGRSARWLQAYNEAKDYMNSNDQVLTEGFNV